MTFIFFTPAWLFKSSEIKLIGLLVEDTKARRSEVINKNLNIVLVELLVRSRGDFLDEFDQLRELLGRKVLGQVAEVDFILVGNSNNKTLPVFQQQDQ